jgi:alkylhydroperoxidase family enzyme
MNQISNQTSDRPLVSPVKDLKDPVLKRPRLEPIEKPKGLKLRIAYWATGRPFGKVPTVIKVMVPRMPGLVKVSTDLYKMENKGIHLDKDLRHMIGTMVSGINGCGFCIDLGRAMAVQQNLSMDKFNALPGYRTSPLFSDKERAALAYAEEATRNKRVPDNTFEELRTHFNDRDIAEITWIVAIQNYYNLLTIPLEIDSDGLCSIAQAKSVKKGLH